MSELTTTNNTVSLFDTQNMQALMQFADIMSKGQVAMPDHLRDKPSDCLAIAMQAAQWGMNPFSVAQKTHIVSGKLGYEAQLVNAVISSSRAIVGRFHYEQVGDWSRWTLNNKASEQGLGVKVGAVLNGESEVTWGETVWFATVATRNSPLWKTQPYQQLCYLGMKYWARLYTPDVILGVYDKDELVQVEREINPIQKTALDDIFDEPLIEAPNNANTPSQFEELRDWCFTVKSNEDYAEVAKAYNEAKNNGELMQDEMQELRGLIMQIKESLDK